MPDLIHRRAQIRRDVKAMLRDIEAGRGNVFVGLSWPTGLDKLPCLVVDTPVEQSANITMDVTLQDRRQQVKVQGRVSGKDDEAILDQLDEMARQVEALMLTSDAVTTLGLKAIELTGTAMPPIRAETDTRLGTIEMTFVCTHVTVEGAPHAGV